MRQQEIAWIDRWYGERSYDTDSEYSDTNPTYLQRVQGVERLSLRALERAGMKHRLSELEVLDFGCGNAKWMGRWLAWGANPRKLHGVDVRPSAIAIGLESFPNLDLRVSEDQLPYPDGFFDVVCQNLVFANMLDDAWRRSAAAELLRVLAPGGLLLWYDMAVNNPKNPNIRKVGLDETRKLVEPLVPVLEKRVVLAPPIARKLTPRSWFLAEVLEASFPLLRISRFGAYQKVPRS